MSKRHASMIFYTCAPLAFASLMRVMLYIFGHEPLKLDLLVTGFIATWAMLKLSSLVDTVK